MTCRHPDDVRSLPQGPGEYHVVPEHGPDHDMSQVTDDDWTGEGELPVGESPCFCAPEVEKVYQEGVLAGVIVIHRELN